MVIVSARSWYRDVLYYAQWHIGTLAAHVP